MAHINLLPWRETLKKEREKRFFLMSGLVALLSVGVVLAIHAEMDKRIEFQGNRNNFLTQQISVLDKEIANIKNLEVEKARLLNRMTVIQQLQKSRPEIVHLFEELVTTTPDGVQIIKVVQNNNSINIEGIADSNSRISTFMRNLDKSKWVKNPELIVINANKSEYPNSSWFSLSVKRSHIE